MQQKQSSVFRLYGLMFQKLIRNYMRILSKYAITILNLIVFGPFANADSLAVSVSSQCVAAPKRQMTAASPITLPIKLLSWNIQKTENDGWQEDLTRYSNDSSLVLLQEANDTAPLSDALLQFSQASLAPGYHTGKMQTGVMTTAKQAALHHCFLQHREPWLRSFKTVQLSWYALSNQQRLLVVNIHSVNFTFGTKDYQQQIQAFRKIAESHQGPMIIAGDFNTWNVSRLAKLDDSTEQLGLAPVTFNADVRKRFFGNPLDHIYIRGLKVDTSSTEASSSSDHNPLFAELSVHNTTLTQAVKN
jgi:endonuclease/exonuclease/phosphatase (EEP) superfamily protein YafD